MAKLTISHKIVFWMFMFGICLFEAETALKITSFEDICINGGRRYMYLSSNGTGILKSEPKLSPIYFDCEVVLLSNKIVPHPIVLSIYKYDVQSQHSHLTIEDSSGFKIALLGSGTFKVPEPTEPYERKSIISDGDIIIRYRRDKLAVPIISEEVSLNGTVFSKREGFQFTFTEARKAPCRGDNEFPCENGICISEQYACDGHNHCGDNSDQRNCAIKKNRQAAREPSKNSNVIWISTTAVAGVVLIILIVVYIFLLVRHPKSKLADGTSNGNLPSGGVNTIPLQSVSSTVPANQPLPPTNVNQATSAPPSNGQPPSASLYDRVRRSLRRPTGTSVNEPVQQHGAESYQVPSMYPSLDHMPSAPEMHGTDIPDFKIEE